MTKQELVTYIAPLVARRMYHYTTPIRYEPREDFMWRFRIKMKDGHVHDMKFSVGGVGLTQYDFIIHFLFKDVLDVHDIEEADLYRGMIYKESYRPREGWFKKGKQNEPLP